MPWLPWFPEPGSYIRYLSTKTGPAQLKYRRLLWRRDPYIYPRRLAAVAAGSTGSTVTFEELNPSEDKKHIHLCYLGVKPGFLYQLFHPADHRTLQWDEGIDDIHEDRTGYIDYELSPYEFPTKTVGIQRDRTPALRAINVSGGSKHPEVVWLGAMYLVVQHEELTADELMKLQNGALRSYPWDFGGDL